MHQHRTIGALPPYDESFAPKARFTAILLRRKWAILLIVILVTTAATKLVLSLPSYYVAAATVIVSTGKTSFGDLQATAGVVPADIMALRTQVDILRSPALALQVVDTLHLVDAPEIGAALHPAPTLVRRIAAPFDWLWPDIATGPDDDRLRAANYLARHVNIQNDGHSYTITIQAQAADPRLAAEIANGFAKQYIDFNRQLKIASINRGGALLDQRLAPLRERVQAAEAAAETYRQQQRLAIDRTASSEGRQNVTTADMSLAQVTAQLLTVDNDLADKRARLQAVQDALRGQGSLDDLPEVVNSPLIQRLRERDVENSARETSLGQTLAGANPALRAANAATTSTRRQITAEATKIAASLENSVRAVEGHRAQLTATLRGIQGVIADQGKSLIGLRQLENEVQAARITYTDYLRRYEMASNNASMQEPEAELISTAQPPLLPAGPPRLQLVGLAAIGSALLGAFAAFTIDRAGGGIRTAEQLEAETGLVALGFIPASRQVRKLLGFPWRSSYAESIRQVGSVLTHASETRTARVISVTSAYPREGKTVFCRSLAISLGKAGKRVLLIDGDTHHSSLSRLRRAAPRAATLEIESATIYREVARGVDLCCASELTSGQPVERNPDALAARLRCIVDAARPAYDLVILDLAPTLATADAPQLARIADGVIVVVRWANTSAQAVSTTCRTLGVYGVEILGGVLTQVDLKSLWPGEGAHAQLYQYHSTYFD